MISDSPGYIMHLFEISRNLGNYGLPLGGGRNLFYTEIMIIVAFIKALIVGRKHHFVLKPFYLGLFFIILYLFMVTFAYDVSLNRLFRGFRGTLPFLLLYAIPKLMNNTNEFNKHFKLLLPFIFIVIGIQLFELFTNVRTVTLIGGVLNYEDELLADGANISVSRPLYSFYILEWILTGVLVLMIYNKKPTEEKYNYFLVFLVIFSIFLSATRGVLLAVMTMFIVFMILVRREVLKTISIGVWSVLSIAILYLFLNAFDTVSRQIHGSFDRILTIEALAKGDITADGTLGRLSVRVPRIMSKIQENPIFGYGFSETYWQYHDGHIGHHNMILNSGFIGYILFWIGIVYLIGRSVRIYKSVNPAVRNRKLILIPIVSLLGIIVHHSTTYTMFSYSAIIPLAPSWFTITMVISLFEIVIKDTLNSGNND
jgi:hypothetical protein